VNYFLTETVRWPDAYRLSLYRVKSEKYLNIVLEYMPNNLSRYNFESRKKISSYLPKQDPANMEAEIPADVLEKIALATKVRDLTIKKMMYSFFDGIAHLHSKGIAHRDLKPDNILVDPEGVTSPVGEPSLKICDLGSAKQLKNHNHIFSELTTAQQLPTGSVTYIATRYYRAPELLYGNDYYGTEIDLWAAGCVLSELYTLGNHQHLLGGPKKKPVKGCKKPEEQTYNYSSFTLFKGQSNMHQLALVLAAKGNPSPS
jgi:serine/threonine protein kinase